MSFDGVKVSILKPRDLMIQRADFFLFKHESQTGYEFDPVRARLIRVSRRDYPRSKDEPSSRSPKHLITNPL